MCSAARNKQVMSHHRQSASHHQHDDMHALYSRSSADNLNHTHCAIKRHGIALTLPFTSFTCNNATMARGSAVLGAASAVGVTHAIMWTSSCCVLPHAVKGRQSNEDAPIQQDDAFPSTSLRGDGSGAGQHERSIRHSSCQCNRCRGPVHQGCGPEGWQHD